MDDYSGNIDQQLLEAYLATDYCLDNPAIKVKIGHNSPLLDQLLMDNNAFNWCIISAWNPYSKEFALEENQKRHDQFIIQINQSNWAFRIGWGKPNNENWKPEQIILILDISREKSIELGVQYQQNAIIHGSLNHPAELILCV